MFVVNLIRAVEYDALDSNGLSQILRRFSLTSSSRSSRVCSQLNVKSIGNSDPAFIGERGDNESRSRAHVLVPVGKASRYLSNLDIFCILIPKVLELLDPLEFIY